VFAIACGGHTSRSSSSTAASSTAARPTSADSSSTAVSSSTPPSPSLTTQAAPTVPADVPTTGPNLLHAGETPPVMPALAMMDSAPGAVAFAKFFMQTFDWGYATTSSTYVRHYFASSCAECSSAANGIDTSARAQQRFIGDRFLNLVAVAVPVGARSDVDAAIKVDFAVTGTEVVDKEGKEVQAVPPRETESVTVFLRWQVTGWVVVDLDTKSTASVPS